MTFHGSNRSFEQNARKRIPHSDANTITPPNDIPDMFAGGPALTFQSSTLPTYRSSAVPIHDSLDSSDCPFHFATSSTNSALSTPFTFSKSGATKQSLSTIDVSSSQLAPSSLMKDASLSISHSNPPLTLPNNHILTSTFTSKPHRGIRRNYRNRSDSLSQHHHHEIWELCKWFLLCLAALGSCVVLVPYLIDTASHSRINLPHHPDTSSTRPNLITPSLINTHRTHRRSKIQGSISHSYLSSQSSDSMERSIRFNSFRSYSHSHSHSNRGSMPNPKSSPMNPIAMDAVIGRIRNINLSTKPIKPSKEVESLVDVQVSKDYQLIRHDKYSILHETLFIVTKRKSTHSSATTAHYIDGRAAIKSTWGIPFKDEYTVNIKFLNCGVHQFNTEFDDVITAPNDLDSAGCLLWAIKYHSDRYRWIFKLEDSNFVMIENLIDYLNQIELESSLSSKGYRWWLGSGNGEGAGYLLNRPIINLLVNDDDVMCQNENHSNRIKSEFECIEYLLTTKHGVHPTSTLDKEGNDKFSSLDPITILGFGDNEKQHSQQFGMDYISKVPITFGDVSPEWMEAYFELLYLHRNAKDIEVISSHFADQEKAMKALNDYAQIVTQYSLTNHIKDTRHEMQRIKAHHVRSAVS